MVQPLIPVTNALAKRVLVARSRRARFVHYRVRMTNSEPLREARKEERFPANLSIRLDSGVGTMCDVSANGIYFVTDVALQHGQPFKFTLEFPNLTSGPIEVMCSALVVRLEERGDGTGVGASIQSFEFRRIRAAGNSSTEKGSKQ